MADWSGRDLDVPRWAAVGRGDLVLGRSERVAEKGELGLERGSGGRTG